MLIESACSVDRVDETLSTLLPMLPEMQYFRFNPGTKFKFGMWASQISRFVFLLSKITYSLNEL